MDEKNGQIAHQRIVAGRRILRNLGRNNNSPATGLSMLKYGQQYVDKGTEYYEQRNRQQQIEFLRKNSAYTSHQPIPEAIDQEVLRR
jgi:hypothetical protein